MMPKQKAATATIKPSPLRISTSSSVVVENRQMDKWQQQKVVTAEPLA